MDRVIECLAARGAWAMAARIPIRHVKAGFKAAQLEVTLLDSASWSGRSAVHAAFRVFDTPRNRHQKSKLLMLEYMYVANCKHEAEAK